MSSRKLKSGKSKKSKKTGKLKKSMSSIESPSPRSGELTRMPPLADGPRKSNFNMPRERVSDTGFTFAGSSSRMAEYAGDDRLSDSSIQNIAATKIQRVFRKQRLSKALKGDDKKELSAARKGFQESGTYDIAGDVEQQRTQANHNASEMSRELLEAKGTRFANMSKTVRKNLDRLGDDTDFSDFKTGASRLSQHEFEEKRKKKTSSLEDDFIKRFEDMASDVRGAFYFNANAQDKILESGTLYSKRSRQEFDMGDESKTTDYDDAQLGNHDHSFFFLEHKNTPMRDSRFTQESSEDGFVDSTDKGSEEDARRLSVPLKGLMREGTWGMKQDFLQQEKGMKGRKDIDNIVASEESDPDAAARDFMGQYAKSALRTESFYKNGKIRKQKVEEALNKSDEELLSTTFHSSLRPQLMVPRGVSLNTPGTTLDMPKAAADIFGKKLPGPRSEVKKSSNSQVQSSVNSPSHSGEISSSSPKITITTNEAE